MEGPKALGYKAHFSGAAAQALLPLLTRETDLAEVMKACTQGRLGDIAIKWENKISVMVYILGSILPGWQRPVHVPSPLSMSSQLISSFALTL